MVFSLFNRKEKTGSRRAREAMLARTADSRPGPDPDTVAAQREAARRTEAKIDQIESEMIAAAVVARAGSAPANPPKAAAPVPRGGAPAAPAGAERGTSLVIGDAADAMAIDVNGPALPSVLEEAAILYSNGQGQAAALVLRQALHDPELAGFQALAWLMLLDLHQCLGDRAGFDALALEYAARFESTPPGWSDSLSPPSAARAGAGGSAPQAADRVVRLAGALDPGAAETIAVALGAAAGTDLEIDFAEVASIDAVAAEALSKLFAHFEPASSTSPGALVLHGAERLFAAARASIEPGRRDRSEAGWMLALQALRALDRQQDFEDLGIEYCVTYEVSPPSWEPISPRIRLAGARAGAPAASPASAARAPAARVASAVPGGTHAAVPAGAVRTSAAQPGAYVLDGEVLGRMQAELQGLREFAGVRGHVVVDCRGLRRMEFVAAGDLLNEVVTMRSAGRQVLFVEPNYLVYALMLVMGIQELAEIRRRKV